MITRRELFQRLAGAVIGVSVAPARVPALAFHPKAFSMVWAGQGLGLVYWGTEADVAAWQRAGGKFQRLDLREESAFVHTDS